MSDMPDYMKNYEEFWKEIVEDENGNLNLDQVAKELYDYSQMIERVTKLTALCSDGKLSYPTYSPIDLYDHLEELLDERYDMGYNDAKEDFEVE